VAFSLSAALVYPQPTPWRRKGLLALVAGLHVLAFVCWPSAPREAASPVPSAIGRMIYLTLPSASWPVLPPPVATRRATAPPARAAEGAVTPAAPLAPPATPEAITAPISAPAARDPFDLPPESPPAGTNPLLQQARRSAGAIDKQLRKESWNPRDKFIANDQGALAQALGAAYTGPDSVTYEELTLPDGRHMTKIHTPAGTMCAYKESNALTGGRDPFQDGIRTKIVACGK